MPRLLARTPSAVKRQALVQLFQATAAAFECDMPPLSGLSQEQRLLAYAWFTREWAENALRRGVDLAELQERLYRNAYHLGRMPGRLLRVNRVDEVMTLGRFLYGILDIDLEGSDNGEITVRRCYFSSFYSPQVCQIMSAMDRGLLAGLSGTGELVFSQRITEGPTCCRAHFSMEQTR
jgi:hypothetical protein